MLFPDRFAVLVKCDCCCYGDHDFWLLSLIIRLSHVDVKRVAQSLSVLVKHECEEKFKCATEIYLRGYL